MKALIRLPLHPLTTVVEALEPGGVGTFVGNNLLMKQSPSSVARGTLH